MGTILVLEHQAFHPVPDDDQRLRLPDRAPWRVHRSGLTADRHSDAVGEPDNGHIRGDGPVIPAA